MSEKVIPKNYGSIPHLSTSKLEQQADKKITSGAEFQDNRGPQSYDPQQNPQGFKTYTPPVKGQDDYEDDIPF